MELRQLRYFIAVAEELHFGRAAERLHMAQPPLSQQIKKLEEDLGVMLFDRTNRRVLLTQEGRKFLCVARNTLETLENGIEQVGMMSRGEIGRLRIGFISSATQTDFTEALAEFRTLYPGIVLDIHEMHSVEQREGLLNNSLDVGILCGAFCGDERFEHTLLLREPYLLAVHKCHPLAKQGKARITDLHQENFITFPRYIHPAQSAATFLEKGVVPRTVQEAVTHHTKLALVSTGLGVALVPARMARTCPKCVRLLPFDWEGKGHISEIHVLWRRGEKSPALECFLEVMEKYCNRDSLPCADDMTCVG